LHSARLLSRIEIIFLRLKIQTRCYCLEMIVGMDLRCYFYFEGRIWSYIRKEILLLYLKCDLWPPPPKKTPNKYFSISIKTYVIIIKLTQFAYRAVVIQFFKVFLIQQYISTCESAANQLSAMHFPAAVWSLSWLWSFQRSNINI